MHCRAVLQQGTFLIPRNMISRGMAVSIATYERSIGSRSQRVERILSNRGVGSRSEVSKMLRQGRVKVEGKIIKSGSVRFHEDAEFALDDVVIVSVPLIAIYHKPAGVHCTMADPQDRRSLADLDKRYAFLKSMHPVGRLDADTSGLLLFSRYGHLTNLLLNPSTGIPRDYEAIVKGKVDSRELKLKLQKGVKTADGVFQAELLDANAIIVPRSNDSDETKDCDEIESSFVRLRVKEGKYRMVRRILHNSGHSVKQLHRVSYGEIHLANLEEGVIRAATDVEIRWAAKISTGQLRSVTNQKPKMLKIAAE
jgi:pseudouridine synthase